MRRETGIAVGCLGIVAFLLSAGAGVAYSDTLTVAYAGSMGVVVDAVLGPQFAASESVTYQGVGEGSFALAHLLESGQLKADVFISATRGPADEVVRAGLARADDVAAVSRTSIVLAYSPRSRFSGQLSADTWITLLERADLRLGRTDPRIDPMGRNAVFALLLAEKYYHSDNLVAKILHGEENPSQIFTETSLLSRLEAGQLDAALCYRSAAASHNLPYVELPPEINLGDPEHFSAAYQSVSMTLAGAGPNGADLTVTPEPLVFYAVPLNAASSPALAARFVHFLESAAVQRIFARYGYGPARP